MTIYAETTKPSSDSPREGLGEFRGSVRPSLGHHVGVMKGERTMLGHSGQLNKEARERAALTSEGEAGRRGREGGEWKHPRIPFCNCVSNLEAILALSFASYVCAYSSLPLLRSHISRGLSIEQSQ